jgi:tellurite resistance-related uncharacterized protein
MLVSGGQILAIDHVVKNDTLVGDGSTKPLGVNTDVIATTALVSDTSSKLQNEINEVSGKFDNYYTKNETSAASAISAALVGVIKHETEVSAADDTIDVSSEILPDGTVVYKIKASSTTNIKGVDPISAELREDGSWYITYHGTQGNIYNEGPNIDIYQVDDQWYISAAVPDVSKFVTSANGYDGKELVLKDNVWVSADYVTDDDIQNLSATIANTYVSASTFNTFSSAVNDKLDELTEVTNVVIETSAKWDNTYTNLSSNSAKWDNVYSLVNGSSADWNEVSGKQDILFLGDTLSGLGTSASPLQAKPVQIVSNNHSITVSSNVLSGTSIFNIEAVNSTIVEASASTIGEVATVSIEQGDLYIVDLSEETTITDIEIVLTNNASVEFPFWWFKIESGSDATLSIKIGAVEVGWLGYAITNIELGKTIEVSVVDNVACGGELV